MGSRDTKRQKALGILDGIAWVGTADVWVRFPSGRVRGPLKAAEAAYVLAGNDNATAHCARPTEPQGGDQ